MGTYYIPRNLRGETRIFYIFTVKSIGLKIVGIVLTAICALAGYMIGAFKIPTISGLPVTKKIGGEPVSEIIARWIKFNKNKKMYVYTKEEK